MRKSFLPIILMLLLAGSLQAVTVSFRTYQVTDQGPVANGNYSMEFGTITCDSNFGVAQGFVQLSVGDMEALPWKLDIHTTNTAYTATKQKGGLLHTAYPATVRLPIAWKVMPSIGPQDPGDPNVDTCTWVWVKDKNDEDMPETPTVNESWDAAQAAGYTAVCNGTITKQIFSRGKEMGTTMYLYLEGNTQTAPSGSYAGTVWFDLYVIPDAEPPTLKHTPISQIMEGNKIVFEAQATDNREVDGITLYYQVDSSSWQAKALDLSGTQKSKTARYSFSPPSFSKALAKRNPAAQSAPFSQKIEYTLAATDGYNYTWFKSLADPQVIEIVNEMTFPATLSGDITVPDGNPFDGSTGLKIPPGALSAPIKLSIKKLDPTEVHTGNFGFGKSAEPPVAVFDFGPEGTQFNKPIELTILYNDLDNDGIVEDDDGVPTGINEKNLQICWWDGFDWRPMGGIIDTALNTVTIKTDHFSTYAVFSVPALTADDFRPKEKIITPATPGNNDVAYFTALNGSDFKINIFDINGRVVRTITPPQMPQWDGKDESGIIVESGVYIYQFEAEVAGHKKLISGTIAVAK